jgi:hypothetical protein
MAALLRVDWPSAVRRRAGGVNPAKGGAGWTRARPRPMLAAALALREAVGLWLINQPSATKQGML